MKHRRTPAWSFTRRRHQVTETSAKKPPVQLVMFGSADDGIAEVSGSQVTGPEVGAAASEEPPPAPVLLSPPLDPVLLISDDAVVEFRLVSSAAGVTLTRTHRRTRHERVVLSVVFGSEAAFSQWCDTDPLRHTYPLLFAQLRRSGYALFNRVE
ncbi:MAG: hypothetical protein ABIN08_07015 [Caldimonas sp.]